MDSWPLWWLRLSEILGNFDSHVWFESGTLLCTCFGEFGGERN